MNSDEADRLGEKEGLRISKIEGRCTGKKPKAKEVVAREKSSIKAELKFQELN